LSGKKLPDYRLKQKILYIDATDEKTLINYGDLFFAEGKFSDALEFYKKARHSKGIENIKSLAMETADVFLFEQSLKALNKQPAQDDWEKIGQNAITQKKYYFARHALEKAGKQEDLNALRKMMEAESHGNEK